MLLNVLVATGTSPNYNLATESYLVHSYKEGLTLYLWSNHNTVVVGKHQLVGKECNYALLKKEGGYLARRMSGGGAVYHDVNNLCFSFIYRVGTFSDKRSYKIITDALSEYGIACSLSGRNDIEVDGKKVSGNAYYTQGKVKVHHGTLLINTDMDRMQRYLLPKPSKLIGHGVDSVRARVANLVDFCPDITKEKLIASIIDSAQRVCGQTAQYLSEDKGYCSETAKVLGESKWLYDFEIYENSVEGVFSWGHADVTFSVTKGVISAINIYTDCLDNKAVEKVAAALVGCNLYEAQPTGDRITDDVIALCQRKIFRY